MGLGQLGISAADRLSDEGIDVLVADMDMTKVENIADKVWRAVQIDATSDTEVLAAGFADCDAVLLAMGERDFEAMVLSAMILLNAGVKRIWARASTQLQEEILLKLGIERVFFPEVRVGREIAQLLFRSDWERCSDLGHGLSLIETKVPQGVGGKSLMELDFRNRFGASVVAIQPFGTEQWTLNPSGETQLIVNSRILLVGAESALTKMSDSWSSQP